MANISQQLADTRHDYAQASLGIEEVGDNPISFFKKWIEEANAAAVLEVNAMTLCTVSNNRPHARIVLLKGIEAENLLFYTNYESHKAEQMADNNHIALVFFWKELERQVRVEGTVSKVSAKQSSEYFDSRPLASRIGALASPQSKVIKDRNVLETAVEKLQLLPEMYIKRPENWGGYEVNPTQIEFWQGRRSRLHDRIIFSKEHKIWTKQRLAP